MVAQLSINNNVFIRHRYAQVNKLYYIILLYTILLLLQYLIIIGYIV